MLTEKQIVELAAAKAKVFRDWENSRKSKGAEYPEYYPCYPMAAKMADHISIHAEKTTFPDRLFRKKAPNEDEAQFQYRRDNYKPVTMPFWNRAMNTINRVWNKQNYTIKWEEKEGSIFKEEKSAQHYFTKAYPQYGSVLWFFESIVTRKKVNDPNAVLAIKPYKVPTTEGENGEIKVVDNVLIEPVGIIYGSEQVVDYVMDSHALILLHERCWIKAGNTEVKEGLVFEYYDKENIYRLEQISKKAEVKDIQFNVFIYYKHGWGKLPVSRLKGLPVQMEDDVLYKSIFFDAVPALDEALYDSSTLQISKVAHAFPQRWEYADSCSAQGCENGYVTDYETEGNPQHKCTTCAGTGRVAKHSPLGVMQMTAPTGFSDGDIQLPAPPAGYIEPGTVILEFLDKQIDKHITRAFAMLNIDVSESEVKGSETALGKQIDREELFALLSTVGHEIFALLEWHLSACGFMRYGDSFNVPQISPPDDFAIRNVNNLTEELSNAKDASIPELALSRIMQQYIKTRFNASEEVEKRIELTFAVDTLATKTPEQIYAGVGAGLIPKWKSYLHDEINIYIDELMEKNSDFLNKDLSVQRALLIKKAKEAVEAEKPKEITAEGILNGMAQPGVETPQDKLKASVGGLTGMIEIVSAVASGMYDLDAAVALAMDRFGLTEEEARKQLGTPQLQRIQDPENTNVALT